MNTESEVDDEPIVLADVKAPAYKPGWNEEEDKDEEAAQGRPAEA